MLIPVLIIIFAIGIIILAKVNSMEIDLLGWLMFWISAVWLVIRFLEWLVVI